MKNDLDTTGWVYRGNNGSMACKECDQELSYFNVMGLSFEQIQQFINDHNFIHLPKPKVNQKNKRIWRARK